MIAQVRQIIQTGEVVEICSRDGQRARQSEPPLAARRAKGHGRIVDPRVAEVKGLLRAVPTQLTIGQSRGWGRTPLDAKAAKNGRCTLSNVIVIVNRGRRQGRIIESQV